MTDGRLLARNTLLNLVGQLLPLVAALVAIPILIRGLGVDRFAILSLAWAAIGYFSLFDFGLARALTQAVAHRLGNGKSNELPAVAWSALLMLLSLGVVGAIVLTALTPWLITRVLNVPAQLHDEAVRGFYILAASLPLVLMSAGLRGMLEAHQHFGAVTVLRIVLVLFAFAGPLMVLPFSHSLVPAILLLATGRALVWAAYLVLCLRRYAFLRGGIVVERVALVPLLRYGGWTTVTSVVSPLMDSLDRFLVGVLLPLAAVAHYVIPYEGIVKLLVIPGAIIGVAFPVFAATFASDRDRMARLYERSLRAVLVLMFPLTIAAVAFAHEALHLWMGPVLPAESAVVLQWLAVGVFINALAQTPFAALQGAGRPDLIAKLHCLELPIYAAMITFLVQVAGLPGVAIAWTIRVAIDGIALLVITRRTLGVTLLPTRGGALAIPLMLSAFGAAALLPAGAVKWIVIAVVMTAFLPLGWRVLLDASERRIIVSLLRGRGSAIAATPEGA